MIILPIFQVNVFFLEETASGEGTEYEAVRVLNGNATYYQ